MQVKHIQDREELILVTNDVEIEGILDDIGFYDDFIDAFSFDVGCLFVEVLDGEYGDIYVCENTVPYLDEDLIKIHPKQSCL